MSKIKDSELYFLVLHWLKSGPCRVAANALQHELQQRELLPTVPTLGDRFQPDYPSLCRLFEHVPQSALRELIEECALLHSDDSNGISSATTPLLEATGSLSLIPSVRTQLTPSTVVIPPPSCRPNFLQRLLQRECAYPNRPLRNDQLIDNVTSGVYEKLRHVKTIRGHRKAVYCVGLDSTHGYALTGADDGVIKIWNLKIGLLKMTCRGHSGEITDLKINCDDSRFASCSNDGTTRVWSLEDDTLGHHIQSMTGHPLGVTFIAFSPVLPSALLSVSLDGTCRLWQTENGIELIRLKPVGRYGHFYNAEAFEKPRELAIQRQREVQFTVDRVEVDVGLTSCAFSPDGSHFAVSSRSGQCFLWHWDATPYAPGKEKEGQTWPDVSKGSELLGHGKCVPVLLFSHQGGALCTASSDGAVKIWRPRNCGKRSASWRGATWETRWSFALPDPLPCPAYNNRRRRTAPECNQIAWSCDDQYVMAAYSCAVIMVWNARNGEEENILYGGHADSPVHVLDAHPTDPKLCFSAGYDGMLILWDIVNGRKITTFSSRDTHPGRWHWADPIQFVDGRFRLDGLGIIVSDVAGQFHLYGLHSATGAMRRTPYDQFFLYDYDKVIISDDGEPVDMESGEPQHIHRTRCPLVSVDLDEMAALCRFSMVDITEEPYEPFLQEILVGGGDLARLPPPTHPPQTPPSLFVLPPTMSAAMWLADEMGLGAQATSTRVTTAQQRQIALMQEEGGYEEVAEYVPPVQIEEPPELPEIEIEEESDGSEYTPDELEPLNSPLATRRSERIQTRSGEPLAARGRRIPTRQNPVVAEEIVESMEEDEADFVEILTEEDEEELSLTGSETTEREPTPSPSSVGPRRRRRLASPTPSSAPPISSVSPYSPRRRRRRSRPHPHPAMCAPEPRYGPRVERDRDVLFRRSTRRRRLNPVFYSASSSEGLPSPSGQPLASARSERAARRAATTGAVSISSPPPPVSFAELAPIEEETEEIVVADPEAIYARGRDERAYQWLSIGDSVAYFSRLHERFCEENPLLATILDTPFVEHFRFAEPCRVISVHYEIFRESFDLPTVARVGLKLTDFARFGEDCVFEVVVPPPFFGHEEFLISEALFLQSVGAKWSVGQHCRVFYFDEVPEWWRGEIVEMQHRLEPSESVWDCEGHYRRYRVQWTEFENVQSELLSPWEMAEGVSGDEAVRADLVFDACLDDVTREKLLHAIAEAKDRRVSKHFRETLAPEKSFVIPGRRRRDNKTLFYNQVVPLPISLKLIKTRLQHPTYYTSLQSFWHDVQEIVENAHLFTGPNSAVSHQAEELQQCILHMVEASSDSDSDSASSEQELRRKAVIRRLERICCAVVPRRRSTLRRAGVESEQRDYQIRTRGMAKREREIEEAPNVANRRRRRYT